MTLLQVPREIREAILEYALVGNFPDAPVDASAATEGLRSFAPGSPTQENIARRILGKDQHFVYTCNSHRFLDTRCFMSGSSGDLPVFYQTVENPALPLLLTCHQLHDEVQDVVARWRRPQYTADVMFVNKVGLWTTWASVPVRTGSVDTLSANFRLFGPPRDLARGIYKRDMWDGTPWSSKTSNGAWGFYDLLNGLLEGNIGPWPKSSSSTIRVKRLVVNITSGTVEGCEVVSLSEIDQWASMSQLPATFLAPPVSCVDDNDNHNHKVAAITFARLVHLLLSILQTPIHRRVYGENLFQRVGVVEVQVDGARYGAEVDLSRSLADVSWVGEDEDNNNAGSPFREELIADLLEWQVQTAERRRRAGFDNPGRNPE